MKEKDYERLPNVATDYSSGPTPKPKAGIEGQLNDKIEDAVAADHLAVPQLGEVVDVVHPDQLVVDEEALGLEPSGKVISFDGWRARHYRTTPEESGKGSDGGSSPYSGDAIDRAKEIYALAVAGGVLLAEIAARMGPSTFAEDCNKAVPMMQEAVELAIHDSFKSVAEGACDRRDQGPESPDAGLVQLLAFEHFTEAPHYGLTIRLVRLLGGSSEADEGG